MGGHQPAVNVQGCVQELISLLSKPSGMITELPAALLRALDTLEPIAAWAECDTDAAGNLAHLMVNTHTEMVHVLDTVKKHLDTGSTPSLLAAASEHLARAQQQLQEGATAAEFENCILRMATQEWPTLQRLRPLLQPDTIQGMAAQLTCMLQMMAMSDSGADAMQSALATWMSQMPFAQVIGRACSTKTKDMSHDGQSDPTQQLDVSTHVDQTTISGVDASDVDTPESSIVVPGSAIDTPDEKVDVSADTEQHQVSIPQQERATEAQVVEQHAKEIAEQHGA